MTAFFEMLHTLSRTLIRERFAMRMRYINSLLTLT